MLDRQQPKITWKYFSYNDDVNINELCIDVETLQGS